MSAHVGRTSGNRRVRDHGVGHRRDGSHQRVRGHPPLPPAGDGRGHGGGHGEVAQPSGREGEEDRRAERDEALARVTADLRARAALEGRRPGHRVGGRGPRRQEGALRRTRPHHRGRRPSSPPTPRPCRSSTWPCTTGRPDKVCGIHFFNPAPVMELVELVRPLTAADETVAAARAFAEACGKTPVEVKDQAGFIVNAPALPLPQQRRPPVRTRCGVHRGHRRGHEGGLRLPHGTVRPPRPGGPRHLARHPRCPLRRVPRPQLRRRAVAAPHGGGRAARPEVRPGFLDYHK